MSNALNTGFISSVGSSASEADSDDEEKSFEDLCFVKSLAFGLTKVMPDFSSKYSTGSQEYTSVFCGCKTCNGAFVIDARIDATGRESSASVTRISSAIFDS